MLDFNVLSAIGIMVAIIIFIKLIMPYLKKNNIEFYEEVKLGLLLFGHVYRDDKVKAISKTALEIVKSLEKLSLTADEKHTIAVEDVFKKLLLEFDIDLPEEAIDLIVRVAVAQLPPTNK